jgi:serine/threonine protein phosphatase PrpC
MRKNDYENLKPYQRFPEEKPKSGCTANLLMIDRNKFLIINLGDSRSIMCTKDGKVLNFDFDHKPDNDIEMKRIQEAGGKVIKGRINGKLNLCRALGDF